MGRTEIPDLSGLQGEPWLVGTVFFQLERNGAFSKADAEVRSKKNLTPPTLSERLINPSPGNSFVIVECQGSSSSRPTFKAALGPAHKYRRARAGRPEEGLHGA